MDPRRSQLIACLVLAGFLLEGDAAHAELLDADTVVKTDWSHAR